MECLVNRKNSLGMMNKKILLLLLSPVLIVILPVLLLCGYWCYCIVAGYIKFYYLFDKEEAEKIVQIDESDIATCQRYCAHVVKDVDYDAVLKAQPYGKWCNPNRKWFLSICDVDSVCLRSLEKELNIDIFRVQYNGNGVMIDLKYRSRTFLKDDTESFIHSVWYNVENEDVLGKHPEYFDHRIKYEKTLSDSLRYVYHTNEWVRN